MYYYEDLKFLPNNYKSILWLKIIYTDIKASIIYRYFKCLFFFLIFLCKIQYYRFKVKQT